MVPLQRDDFLSSLTPGDMYLAAQWLTLRMKCHRDVQDSWPLRKYQSQLKAPHKKQSDINRGDEVVV